MAAENNTCWIVIKKFRVRRDGELVMLLPGDEIPEAAGWDNADYWKGRGFIRCLNRPMSEKAKQFAPKALSSAQKILEAQALETQKKSKPKQAKAE